MSTVPPDVVATLRELLAARAEQLELQPVTIRSVSPAAVTARREDGSLLRIDVTLYSPAEVSR